VPEIQENKKEPSKDANIKKTPTSSKSMQPLTKSAQKSSTPQKFVPPIIDLSLDDEEDSTSSSLLTFWLSESTSNILN
jgi:hypothetical protein